MNWKKVRYRQKRLLYIINGVVVLTIEKIVGAAAPFLFYKKLLRDSVGCSKVQKITVRPGKNPAVGVKYSNVLVKGTMLAIVRNINRFHSKIQNGRTGTYLFSLKSA